MKRRITIEQLHELTKEQRQQISNWWNPDFADVIVAYKNGFENEFVIGFGVCNISAIDKKNSLPLLDIGQMIEILDPKEETIFTMCKFISANPPIYEITVNGDYYYGGNMCDALWEAVKSILDK